MALARTRRSGTGRDTEDDGHRAVDRAALRAEAPEEVVVLHRHVQRPLRFRARAPAAHAERLAAAVVVGDDVVLPVARVAARPDPRDRRHLGARRTGVLRTAAARTEETVDGAVPPIVAARRIADVAVERGVVRYRDARIVQRCACDGQHRHARHADQRGAEAGEKGAPGRVPGEVPGHALDELVNPLSGPLLGPLPASGVGHDCAPPARYSWTEATPRSCASNRLSRCSRVLTSPFPRTIPSPSTSTAYGSFPTWYVTPSAGDRRYGNASSRCARTNASCSARAPSLASTTSSQPASRRAIERIAGRSVLQTGHVGERKKRSVPRRSACGAPTSCGIPARSTARTTGAASPTAGPVPRTSAPAGATRS